MSARVAEALAPGWSEQAKSLAETGHPVLKDLAPATPTTRLAVEMMPSLAPNTEAPNHPTREMKCGSACQDWIIAILR